MVSQDTELDLLESIYRSGTRPNQRDLARTVGLSLGMTNVIVKRIARKGWLSIRKVNNRNIQYVVSAAGVEEITRRSYRYLRRTITDVVRYRDAVEELLRLAAARGCRKALLVGQSDLDFLVEHASTRAGMQFEAVGSSAGIGTGGADAIVILSERLDEGDAGAYGAVPLRRVLAQSQPVR